MKPVIKNGGQGLCLGLFNVRCSMFRVRCFLSACPRSKDSRRKLSGRRDVARLPSALLAEKGPTRPASPTLSNPVKPSPTKSNHPPPPGKETGKETVKFLALFDHLFLRHPTKSDQLLHGWKER
jgi:hypothetical protein